MKPVSLMYWDEEMKTIQTVIKEEPDPIHTNTFSIVFQWIPDTVGSGCIPVLSDYKLYTTIMYNIDWVEKQLVGAKCRKFDVMDMLVQDMKNECFKAGIIVDPDRVRLFPICEKDMEASKNG